MKLMTEFMEENPDLAKSFSASNINSRETQRMLWERLTLKLNVNGPPTKTKAEWKRIWTTRKYSAKKKLIENKKSIAKTGGGPYTELPLDSNEEAIIQVCGIEAAVAGIGGVSSFGCDEQILETEITDLIGDSTPSEQIPDSAPAPSSMSTKNRQKQTPKEEEGIILARRQVELQEKFVSVQEDIGKSLKEVTVAIKDMKDCVALLCQEKEKERQSANALKKEELQLKRMEIELAKAATDLQMLELRK
ncbi:uncharacterized protein LOC129909647 [Episyrphus balteatus]|uniref:uncharacterized protein LOC129909647 n=1 Tax=Episyrphus balteatus TaxID=286459 RepID=UPI0024869A7A|nr:uncharacterized protein LOC129909647 [Episyrphus balteatus]